MPNTRHLNKLLEGAETWNRWRQRQPHTRPDLSGAFLHSVDLNFHGSRVPAVDPKGLRGPRGEVSLRGVNLAGAKLSSAMLIGVDGVGATFTEATLDFATLSDADLRGADFRGAHLVNVNLSGANLHLADFHGADLTAANLSRAIMIRTTLTGATLRGCRVYGVAAWDVSIDANTVQQDLVLTPTDESAVLVDDLELAQFIHFLLRNDRVRRAIDSITAKVVLILGRFTPERKPTLDSFRTALRARGYAPVIFDFDKPHSRDTHETVTLLARMARFVIADITDPKSIPQELVAIVEQLPSLPIQPILEEGREPWGMYDHIKRYPWVLPVRSYRAEPVTPAVHEAVIAAAEEGLAKIRRRD